MPKPPWRSVGHWRWLCSRAWPCALAIAALTGCGDSGGEDGEPPDGGPVPGTCRMSIDAPDNPTSETQLVLYGIVNIEGGVLDGARNLDWTVRRDGGAELSTPQYGTEQNAVEIASLGQPGVYRIELTGTVDTVPCDAAIEEINVRHERAIINTYRLRAVAPSGADAPVQDHDIDVYGGGNAIMPRLQLRGGRRLEGSVKTDTDQGAPAYLRFTAPGFPQVETFAGPDGQYAVALESSPYYEVLVVPQSSTLAPLALPAAQASDYSLITVTGGEVIAGVVTDGQGIPVVGARVTGHVEAAPTTIAVTDEDGRFTLRASVSPLALATLALTVIPPPSSGLPQIELSSGAGVEVTGELDIKYAPSLTSRTVSIPVRHIDGSTPAEGARVTLRARPMSDAATITVGGQDAGMDGTARVTGVVDGAGMSPQFSVPEAIYDAIVEPPASSAKQGFTVAQVDLRPGRPTPAALNLVPTSRIVGEVRDEHAPEAPPLTDIDVFAQPLALLANAPAASTRDTADATGFSLPVAASSEYRLTASSPDRRYARTVVDIATPAAGQDVDVGALYMTPTLEIRGSVSLPDSTDGSEGVHLTLLCYDCTGVDAQRPIAEVVSSSTGEFTLHVPDPGLRPDGQ